MSGFLRSGDEKIGITLSSQEAHVLINLTEQIIELLGEEDGGSHLSDGHTVDDLMRMVGISTNDAPPIDPVLLRLLPSAYKNAEQSAEFRRYTEHGLREKKRANAMTIREALIPQDEDWDNDSPLDVAHITTVIEAGDELSWLAGMNDIRLALAVRLDIGVEKDTKPQHEKYELMVESDPMKAVYAVYAWIGWLQESLLKLL
ncbi:hypothetical protein LBMAG09_06700 [Actinomycetes bacterium]|nr:hypothetical protein LBMAG09_06700 [Actinomycetes bacterium]